ncbi:hypothetical protein AB685_03760 [Bacillus sp. LL01]|uniref:fluoroquinolone export ABC transporter permease subunit n=1 Tax=Bacillus sp. LL01 TaxID=1665556 RepID=UPI00064D57A6|nr:hypothetical protein [Bacillus sp. LL01]KMJ59971.1 hypothetical protein AB685_03760 [Bacillus sp. LL01]
MWNLPKMLKADIRFQYLHGFYYAYLFMVTVYILLLHASPQQFIEPLTILVVFTDPTVLGCFFIGGIVLLEKSQNVYGPLFMTSLQVKTFIASKVLSLSVISLVSSLAILIFVHKVEFQFAPILAGVVLSSIVFTLIGFLLAVRVQTVNQFLLASPLVITVFFLPVVIIFDWWDSVLLKLLPSYAGILLIQGAFQSISWGEVVYAIITLVVWSFVLFLLAVKSFINHVLEKGEGNS